MKTQNSAPQMTLPSMPPAPRVGRRRAVALLSIAGLAALLLALGYQANLYPKRFAPVVEGRLYRSGEVSPDQLARLQQEYGIGRVICLLNPTAPVTQAERDAAAELGLEWHNIGMRGDGSSTAADRARLLELLQIPDAPPTLVHCAAGVNRTGLAVGLYRIHEQGWTYEQVLEEMRANDFDDLPKHENLRQALREAAAAANSAATTSAGE
jgi:protein tyrosine/serine phosphatase